MEKEVKNKIRVFFEKIKKDAKGEKILEKIKNSLGDGTDNLGSLVEEILSIAKTEGCNFSKEEIYNYLQEELLGASDEALKMASGGAKRFGGGDFGKAAALFAGTAGLGGLGMMAFGGNIFGGNGKDVKKDNTVNSKKQVSKNKDKKSVQKGLDDIQDEDIGSISTAGKGEGGATSSRLRSGLRRRSSPDFDPYSYGGGSSYGSRRGGMSRGSAEKLQNTLLEFLNKCSSALRSKGMDASPEDIYGAIVNGTLENALGDSAIDFIMALRNGDVNSAVNLVVSALTKNVGARESAAKKIQSDPKYKKMYEGLKGGGKGISPKDYEELLNKLNFEEEDEEKRVKDNKKEMAEEKKEEVDKPENKKEEIKKEEKENEQEKQENKDEKADNAKNIQENKAEEKIKVVNAEFLGDEAKTVKSFDIVYFEDGITKEEITQWFNKIKEETKEERAIMCSGENLEEIKKSLKEADKNLVICENKNLGKNQFVVIVKDSEDKKAENFFKDLKEAKIDVKNVGKAGDLKQVVDGIASGFKEKKENEKNAKEKEGREKLEKYKEDLNKKLLDEKLAELKIKKAKGQEEPKNMLIVNEGATEEKIKEKIKNNDVIIEVLDENGNSKLGNILNKEDWEEVEQKSHIFGFFVKDKDKSVKIHAKKSICKDLGQKNELIGEYHVVADFINDGNDLKKEYSDLGSIKDFMKVVKDNNIENKKIDNIKKEIDDKNKAQGNGDNEMPKELLKKIIQELKAGKSAVNMPVTLGVGNSAIKANALFLPGNNYIKAENIPEECDVIVKKGNVEQDLKDINKRRGWWGYFFNFFYREDKELRGFREFVPIYVEKEKDKKGNLVNVKGGTIVLVRKKVLSNYIIRKNGEKIIIEHLEKSEEWEKVKSKYKKDDGKYDIGKFYMEKFNPEKEEYYDNIFNLAEKCEDLKNILTEFAGNIKVKDENSNYEDYCKNFLENLNTVNNMNKK